MVDMVEGEFRNSRGVDSGTHGFQMKGSAKNMAKGFFGKKEA